MQSSKSTPSYEFSIVRAISKPIDFVHNYLEGRTCCSACSRDSNNFGETLTLVVNPIGQPLAPKTSTKGPVAPALLCRLTGATLAGIARIVSGYTVRWIDCQPDLCQRIYFANHTSHLDAVVLWSALPRDIRALTRPVAAMDYWGGSRFKRFLAKSFNALLIDRKEIKVHQSPVELMLREIGDLYSLIVFPEGGRSLDGEMAEFKSGLYYLTKKRPDLELVPVYMENLNRILPRGEVFPVPLLSSITIGSPISLKPGESKMDFLSRARDAVKSLKDR